MKIWDAIWRVFCVAVVFACVVISPPALANRVHVAAHAPRASKSVAPPVQPIVPPSAYALEAKMNAHQLVDRWKADIDDAAKRIRVPGDWIRAVMIEESGGRTMLAENAPITSSMGAMGLMQVMPETWRQMQHIYALGNDPYDPRDNILAGAAELRSLYWEYGYPGLFAAYNDGPGMIEAHRRLQQLLPPETGRYMVDIAAILQTGDRLNAKGVAAHLLMQSPQTHQTADTPRPAPKSDKDDDDDYYNEY